MKHNDSDSQHKEEKKPEEKTVQESTELVELRQQLETLQKEKDDFFAQLQRVSADYINFQKRVPKQIADTVAYEKEKIIRTILPTLDNFELTLQNASGAGSIEDLLKGIKIIYDHLLDILKSHNVEQIRALGEKFDPSQHEAMIQKTDADKNDNIVLEEYQKGYKLNDRVIRPSRVVVNKLPSQQQAEPVEDYETKDTE